MAEFGILVSQSVTNIDLVHIMRTICHQYYVILPVFGWSSFFVERTPWAIPTAPVVNLTINDVQSAMIRPNVRTTTILNYKFCEISASLNLYACLIMIYDPIFKT